MLYYERKLKKRGFDLVIGVDEAGRGPLAGPVVAAAVALKTHRFRNRIDDSKRLSPQAREEAYQEIIGKSLFGIGIVNERIIDRINIFCATRLAMEQAVAHLLDKIKPLHDKRIHIIVDGNVNLDLNFPCQCILKGDSKSKTIASASILAKVMRDRIMNLYDRIYPAYRFCQHKGYPTKSHRALLKRLGPTAIHRKSFCGV